MAIIKYLERLKRMDDLIRRKATGSSEEFARKMGLSRSSLMDYIKSLKELNAPIGYDHFLNSYYYLIPCKLKIGFESRLIEETALVEINKKSLEKFCKIITVQK